MAAGNIVSLFRGVANAAFEAKSSIYIGPVQDPMISALDNDSVNLIEDSDVGYNRFVWVANQWGSKESIVGP